MEKKINLVKLLKDCPKGMELDCTMYEDCKFLDIDLTNDSYVIRITTGCGVKYLDKYGRYSINDKAKCVIFPKGKTTWEGFALPYKFKDGDIVSTSCGSYIFILKGECLKDESSYHGKTYLVYCTGSDKIITNNTRWYFNRLATEKEKQKLFDAIKDNGYKWNEETKTLEKLIIPKFKVGDRIRLKSGDELGIITQILENCYKVKTKPGVSHYPNLSFQDFYELVPNKFDITTLKPFDKVLVRDNNEQKWTIDYFSFVDKKQIYPFICIAHYATRCIPYEENKHLLGTVDDCDEYYKTWK